MIAALNFAMVGNGRARDHLIPGLAPSVCIPSREYVQWPRNTNAWVELVAVDSMNHWQPDSSILLLFCFHFSCSELTSARMWVSVVTIRLWPHSNLVVVVVDFLFCSVQVPMFDHSCSVFVCCMAVADVVVVAAGADHHVPAGNALHQRRARLQYDDLLCSRWTSRADHHDRQNHMRRRNIINF